MTVTEERPAQAVNAAKRGDLVVIEEHHHDYVLHGDNREYDAVTAGIVTSVTRDGMVKMFKEAGHTDNPDYLGRPDKGRPLPMRRECAMVMSAKDIDVRGALATAACHTWKGHDTQVKAYDSLDELRSALRPHLWASPASIRLSEAGGRHATERREAWESYLSDQRRGHDPERYAAYQASVVAANETYRANYAAATVKPQAVAA